MCSTFFYDLFSASPSLPIHLPNCMQVNQSANICILIMWLLRLNAHHKFGLCVANHIFYPSHSSSSSIQTTSLCLLLFVYTSQCVCWCTHQFHANAFHIEMVSWRLPENKFKRAKKFGSNLKQQKNNTHSYVYICTHMRTYTIRKYLGFHVI